VLGAFLTGVLTTRVGSAAMLCGMIAGTIVVSFAWWTAVCAWTWFALVGAATTGGSALLMSLVLPRRSDA
jgi:solute:Na+ symporter, SSS family